MNTLQILLKLFPTAFQNQMGEAWLEASETEIRQRQKHEDKKFSVLVAFAIETIFTVIPQSYRLKEEQKKTALPHDFVPTKNEKVAQIVNFCTIWWVFHCVGMIAAVHVMLASMYSPANMLVVYGSGVLLTILCLSYKNIHQWWIKNDKPIISLLGGSVVGFVFTYFIVFVMLMPGEIQAAKGQIAMYEDLRKQMGYENKGANEWFEETRGYTRVRPERKEQWCVLSRARLEGVSTSLQDGQDNTISGHLISALLSDTYAQGCWGDENQYIAQRHKIAARAATPVEMDNLFSVVDGVLVFKEWKNMRENARAQNLYSAQKYCWEYTAKIYHTKTGKFIQKTQMGDVCKNWPEGHSLTTAQARTIRLNSGNAIQKLMEGA